MPLDLRQQHFLHARPVIVDDRIPRRVPDRVRQNHVLPEDPVEAKRVHVREPVDLRLALGRDAQPLAMTFLDRLDSDDAALERRFWTQFPTIHVFEYRRTGITRTNRLATRMTNPPEFLATGGAVALQPVAVARKTPRQLFWERLSKDKVALSGGVVIILLLL